VFSEFFDNPAEEIKRLIFRMNFVHQFPVTVNMQVFFFNSAGDTLDVLFHDENDPKRIIQGTPEFEGDVAVPFEPDPVEVVLTEQQIENISDCEYIIVEVKVNTSDNDGDPNVKFYSYYFFDAWLGVIAELELNSDDY
jgi:hypothetical protein